MRKLLVLAALAACCLAAPTPLHESDEHTTGAGVPLQRPSPISPDIPSDPKPAETITVITDPKEIAKHNKRETVDDHTTQQHIIDLTPTAQPLATTNKHTHSESHKLHQHDHLATPDSEHHRQKRDQKPTKKSTAAPAHKPAAKKSKKRSPAAVPVPAPARDLPHRQQRDVTDALASSTTAAATPLIDRSESKLPQHATTLEPASTSAQAQPIARPALARVPLTGSVGLARPQTLQAHIPFTGVPPTVRPQTLPALDHELPTSTAIKRDIPVPLVAKYHHPEETVNEEQEKQGEQHAATEKKENKQKQKEHKGKPHNAQTSSEESDESKESTERTKDKTPSQATQHTSEQPQHASPALQTQEHAPKLHSTQPGSVHQPVTEQLGAAAASSTPISSSTTSEHPIIRHHPVPVAELFARPKQ